MPENPIIWYLMINVLSILICVLASEKMNKNLNDRHPQVKPFRWGYFVGCIGILVYSLFMIVAIILLLADIAAGRFGVEEFIMAFFFIAPVVTFYYYIKRAKWAIILGTILSFGASPIIGILAWIFNIGYMKNRWNEFNNEFPGYSNKHADRVRAIIFSLKNSPNNSIHIRPLVIGSVFWALVFLAFVFIFDPYGRRISGGEWLHAIMMITFPILVTFLIKIRAISLFKNLFNNSIYIRWLVIGSVFWVLVVLAFVFIFDPYGRRIDDREWWQAVKIITFPPLVAITGYFLYTKFIKAKNGDD